MKKTCLSINQMQVLQGLGVETRDASMVLIFFTENGEELSWDQLENHGKDTPLWEWYNEDTEIWEPALEELFEAETGNYDHSYREGCGVFTLQDMIDKFPKTVYSPHGIPGCVSLVKGDRGYACFSVAYKTCAYVNPMDAAYDMLIWLARNRYLKGGRK